MGKFEIIKGKDERFRFNLRASNGEIIATGEVCDSYKACAQQIEAARRKCGAPVEDQIAAKEQLEGTKYELYLDKAGEFRFRLRLKDGTILFHGEGYRSKASCKKCIQSVAKNAPDAPVISLV